MEHRFKTIEEGWKSYEKAVLGDIDNPDQLMDLRLTFLAGAKACWHVLAAGDLESRERAIETTFNELEVAFKLQIMEMKAQEGGC